MTALSIGPGQQYDTIARAVAAAKDGDVLQIQAGTYINDFANIDHKITLQGVGGMAVLKATVAPSNGKAILVTNTDVTLDHLELTGAAVPDGNGAGIRYQGGALVVTNSYIHDNQDGILGGAVPGGSVTIRNTEIAHNGTGDGGTHNVYINRIDSLTIDGSNIHDAVLGHQVKSRADATTITNSVIDDGAGNGSYSVDLPEGGKVLIKDTVLHQGAASSNPAIVHFGGEGEAYPGSSLQLDGVTVINDLASPSAAVLLNQTGVVATIANLSLGGTTLPKVAEGLAQILDVPGHVSAPAADPAPATPPPVVAPTPEPVTATPDPTHAPDQPVTANPVTETVPPKTVPADVVPPPAADPVADHPVPLPDSFHFPDTTPAAPDPVIVAPVLETAAESSAGAVDPGLFQDLQALMAISDPGLQEIFSMHMKLLGAAGDHGGVA